MERPYRGEGRRERRTVVVQQRRHGRRDLAHAPRADHVAEVDHGIRQRILHPVQHIVVGDVEVPGLRRQRLRDRSEGAQRVMCGRADELAHGGIRLEREERVDHPAGVPEVPLQHASTRGMVEIGQCETDAGRQLTHAADHSRGEIARPHQGATREVLNHPRMDPSLRGVPPRRQGASGTQDHARHAESGLTVADGRGRRVLHLDLGLAEDRVAQLEDAEGLGRVAREDAEILVLLAAERRQIHFDAEGVGEETPDLGVVEGRRGQFDVLEIVEELVRHGLSSRCWLMLRVGRPRRRVRSVVRTGRRSSWRRDRLRHLRRHGRPRRRGVRRRGATRCGVHRRCLRERPVRL